MKLAASLLAVLVMGTSCGPRPPARSASAEPAKVIPADWLDLPDAPFVSKVVKGKAVLVNRTSRWFNEMMTGCVTQRESSVQVVGSLFGHQVFDSAWGPGHSVDSPLWMINRIDYYVTANMVKRCPSGSRTALTVASGENHRWIAEGTSWPR